MKRFHKGAFYLSEKLQLDIIPVILYGNCKIIAKAQPFNVRKGIMLTEILRVSQPTMLRTEPLIRNVPKASRAE